MRPIKFYKATSLPANPEPDSIYFIKDVTGTHAYITDINGVAEPLIEEGLPITTDWVRTITVENPTNAENIAFFYTDVSININKISAVLTGSASPSVTWTIRFGTIRNSTGTEVVVGGTTTTTVTTPDVITVFDNEIVPANRIFWLETTAKSGIVDEMSITLIYTKA